MTGPDNAATCHWRTATRLMPTPYWFEAGVRPWSCLREGTPRPLSMSEVRQCATCPHWQPRTFEASKRDLIVRGVGRRSCRGAENPSTRSDETWCSRPGESVETEVEVASS